jgi:hypothetical protein
MKDSAMNWAPKKTSFRSLSFFSAIFLEQLASSTPGKTHDHVQEVLLKIPSSDEQQIRVLYYRSGRLQAVS